MRVPYNTGGSVLTKYKIFRSVRQVMQRPDAKKRDLISATAARLFAKQPFHKVRLDDVAAAAGVGKGTLYIYFDSKEDLYFSLLYDGFTALIDTLKRETADHNLSAVEELHKIVHEMVEFAFGHPHSFELMRRALPSKGHSEWDQKRLELVKLIEDTIRRGVRDRLFCDPAPHLTALMIPGLLRSLMLYGPSQQDRQQVQTHILRLVERGIFRTKKEHP